jgi:hypothetical protein
MLPSRSLEPEKACFLINTSQFLKQAVFFKRKLPTVVPGWFLGMRFIRITLGEIRRRRAHISSLCPSLRKGLALGCGVLGVEQPDRWG